MPKFSVKKPFTILVTVIMAIVLGVVSVMNMSTDLLPTISLPYLMVIATYPGASPEKVETELTALLEASLGTVNGVETVSSTSSENYCTVMLEFTEGTNMDSAMVKTSTALNQLAGQLPEGVPTPSVMELSMDMMATQYVGVNVEGMDIYELSDYVKDHVVPEFERINGVANVSVTGLVERAVKVELQQEMIDEVNDKLLVKVSDKLADAKKELDKAKREMSNGKKELNEAKDKMKDGKTQLETQQGNVAEALAGVIKSINDSIPGIEKQIGDLEGTIKNGENSIAGWQNELSSIQSQMNDLHLDAEYLAALNAILAANDAAYDAAQMPNTFDEVVSHPEKLEAMLASIDRAKANVVANYGTAEEIQAKLAQANQKVMDLTAQLENPELTEEERADLQAQLATASEELAAQQKIAQMQQMLDSAEDVLKRADELNKAQKELNKNIDQTRNTIETAKKTLEGLRASLKSLNDQRAQMQTALKGLEDNPLDTGLGDMAAQLIFSGMNAQLALGEFQITSGLSQLEAGEAQLETAEEQYEKAREEALKSANLDQLLNMQTLSGILTAQNFNMPAGYIQDGEEKVLLKVGDTYDSIDELGGTLLCNIDGIGDVRLRDVATITVTDNSGDGYAKMDGNQMVLLSIFKASTASTSDVSDACNKRAEELMAEDAALKMVAVMDQGEYIRFIVSSVVSNLLWGAALAIFVLALFLKDIRPTLVVAISIPLSVMVAIVLMYFTHVTLNVISLSGLALGIGMLVDNSVVVIENIYRLRARGVPAARASVQGARQVAGSIISSTLTTVCVFAPLVFATGMVRQLLTDLGLTIAYSLLASLVVALSVVPCAGSTLLRKQKEIKHPWFDKALEKYGVALQWCLRHKLLPMAVAVGLLGVSVVAVMNAGIVMLPEMGSNQLSAEVTMPEGTPKEEAFATADSLLEIIGNVEGVQNVGAMTSDSMGSIMGMGGGREVDMTRYTFYLILTEEGGTRTNEISDEIMEKTADLNCEVELSSGSSMDMSQLSGSGLEVDIQGRDLNTLMEISEQVADLMREIEGTGEISNGQEDGDNVVKVLVDKDKAMRLGLTTAQVYMTLSQALTNETTSTTLDVGSETYTVTIVDNTGVPDMQEIFDYEFKTTTTDEDGAKVEEIHKLNEFASRQNEKGVASIRRTNQARRMSVNAEVKEGYTTNLLARELQEKLKDVEWPKGYIVEISGENAQVNDMVYKMAQMMALAFLMIYFIMVAQFQSLLSPFIVLFTVPLAFTGGMIALLLSRQTMSMLSLMGFLILMGVVVNNGIVFVDYTNQLRIGGLERRDALVATGKTRMRPILMTTLTTVLSMLMMMVGNDMGSEMGKGMATVVVGGLLYATLMTLFVVPIIYDVLFKRQPVNVDVGDDGMDDLPDDAAEYMAQLAAERAAKIAAAAEAAAETAETPETRTTEETPEPTAEVPTETTKEGSDE